MDSPFFIVMWILSVVFSLVTITALGVYVVRTLQKIRGPAEIPGQDEILDHLDQIQSQLYGMSARLQRMEERLLPPPAEGAGAPPDFGED